MQIRKASNIDITKLQKINTKLQKINTNITKN